MSAAGPRDRALGGQDIADLATGLAAARLRVDQGLSVELEPLARRLAALLALPGDGGGAAPSPRPAQLLGLLDELATLAHSIADERDRCSLELNRSSTRTRAVAAYHDRARS